MNPPFRQVQALSPTRMFCVCIALCCGSVFGQTNRWTNSVSGYCEQPRWLLGRLPGTNQTIFFRNPGSKVLTIGTNTTRNFPQTLTINSLTIGSPANSFNELLLNYAGLQIPLWAHALFVSNNAAVVALDSALDISDAGGELVIDGALKQGGFSSVRCDHLVVGSGGAVV